MSHREWAEALRRRVADAGMIAPEIVINLGADWLDKQTSVCPKISGLCLEFISRHIVRRLLIVNGQEPEQDSLQTLLFLAEKLEKRGVDCNIISIKVLETMTGKSHQKKQISKRGRPLR